MAVEIFHKRHSQWEEWLTIENRHIHYHSENDQHSALRHGLDQNNEILSLETACRRWPEHAQQICELVSL